MNKTRLVTYLCVGLLISNLLLIAFMFLNKPNREGPKKIIAERLHFDAQQINNYDKLIAIHRKKINAEDSLIMLTKNELYASINSNNTLLKDSLEKKLGQLQIDVEEIHYNHFLDIKKLCKENQLACFDTLLKDMAHLFAKPDQRSKH